jgi:hypothetical protein
MEHIVEHPVDKYKIVSDIENNCVILIQTSLEVENLEI